MKCLYCGKEFIDPKHTDRKYCSRHCFGKNNTGHTPWNKNTKGIMKSNSGCFKKGHKTHNAGKKFPQYNGAGNSNWKGGEKKDKEGYVLVYCPDHPNARGKYVRRNRLVMEASIGRYLRPKEVVHHINGIKNDDRPENLMLFANNGLHRAYHRHFCDSSESTITARTKIGKG
jgi:hypothetical protein